MTMMDVILFWIGKQMVELVFAGLGLIFLISFLLFLSRKK